MHVLALCPPLLCHHLFPNVVAVALHTFACTLACYLFTDMEMGFKIIKTPAEQDIGYLPRGSVHVCMCVCVCMYTCTNTRSL